MTVLGDHGGSFTGRLWTYLDPLGRQVVFDAPATHERDAPETFPRDFRGAPRADAYAGYDAIYRSGRVREIGCWAHARRRSRRGSPTPSSRANGRSTRSSPRSWRRAIRKSPTGSWGAGTRARRFAKGTFDGCDVSIEALVAGKTLNELKARGHDIRVVRPRTGTFGYGQAVMSGPGGVHFGASEPRHDGAAIPQAPLVFEGIVRK